MAKNALSVTKLNIKVNHLEEEFFQLNKRVSMLEAEKENHKKIPSTPKIIQNESAVSKNDSPLTRIGKDFKFQKFNCYFILFYFISAIFGHSPFFSLHKN